VGAAVGCGWASACQDLVAACRMLFTSQTDSILQRSGVISSSFCTMFYEGLMKLEGICASDNVESTSGTGIQRYNTSNWSTTQYCGGPWRPHSIKRIRIKKRYKDLD
jgi:hypothetical protein